MVNTGAGIVADILCAAVLVGAFARGRRKGAVKMIYHAAAWIVSLVLAAVLSAPFAAALEDSAYVDDIKTQVGDVIEEYILEKTDAAGAEADITAKSISEATGVPLALIPSDVNIQISLKESVHGAAAEISDCAVDGCVRAAAEIGLFVLIRIAMTVLYYMLNLAAKLPIITGVNRLLGALMGFIGALFAVYSVLAAAAVFFAGTPVSGVVEQSVLVRYFYDNNVLLKILQQ